MEIKDPARLLSFWHQVEYFIPYDLEGALDGHQRRLDLSSLVDREARQLWSLESPKGMEIHGFVLFLGVFDPQQAARLVSEQIAQTLSEHEKLEQQARLPQQRARESCIASIHLDENGRPLWSRASVSTFPWATGRILGGASPDQLGFEHYLASEAALKEQLEDFRTPRLDENDQPLPLSGNDVILMVELLEQWCEIDLSSIGKPHRLATIQPRFRKQRKQKKSLPRSGAGRSEDEVKIDILNSFFARDLAWALYRTEGEKQGGRLRRYLERLFAHRNATGTSPPACALDCYFRPLRPEERTALDQDRGRKMLRNALWPSRLPLGRWPADSCYSLSLMQQFAVNHVLNDPDPPGLFSVNGPPGTGKTTLLRDFIAALITQRAEALARLQRADDAFEGTMRMPTGEGKFRTVKKLRSELAGYEMVVVSSNNTAVENVSRDLPKTGALGTHDWCGGNGEPLIRYLQPVAYNIAARQGNGDYRLLDPDQQPWGLISAILGKRENRERFKESFFFVPGKEEPPREHFDPEQHQTIRIWRRKQREQAALSFAEAAERFRRVKKRTAERIALLEAAIRHQLLEQEINRQQEKLDELNAALIYIEGLKPGLFSRWFTSAGWQQWRGYRKERYENRSAYEATYSKMKALKRDNHELLRQLREPHAFQQLLDELPAFHYPVRLADLDEPSFQIEGLWPDSKLNHLRAQTFAAAMELHQAWVAEASLSDELFCLSDLLKGQIHFTSEQSRILWQQLFMIVPVVSSTLASVASQFRNLAPGSLGWVFVDEAGQAPPHWVVGILLRARRAVVVGDPLQIEPVFTVPLDIVKALMKTNRIEEQDGVSPHQTSAQEIADAANPLGVTLRQQGGDKWLGSPLRVHRRCQEPMFSIANTVAYDGRMIQATVNADRPGGSIGGLDPGPSSWIDLAGETKGRHVVPEQVDFIHRALEQWLQHTGQLPPLYIISPFREVAAALHVRLRRNPRIKFWLEQTSRCGTVHTFQGKEAPMVWLVLGCDASRKGAARWAAQKPNLLNVAVTRAKSRFFIIGERALWSELPHFSVAAGKLPTVSPAQFMTRLVPKEDASTAPR